MADDPERPSREMPWPLRIWLLAIMAIAVTAALVLLAVLIDSDVTRVALPAIAGAIGTIGLAVVTVRLSIQERAHQDQLRLADEQARRREAEHQQEIKEAEKRAASEREAQLELDAAVRQARRVVSLSGWEGTTADVVDMVTLVNGSDYPIFDITLIGARLEEVGGRAIYGRSLPDWRLDSVDSLNAGVLLPGERHVFQGTWKRRKGLAPEGGMSLRLYRRIYTWRDDQGGGWLRDGSEPPRLLPRPFTWTELMEFWNGPEYE